MTPFEQRPIADVVVAIGLPKTALKFTSPKILEWKITPKTRRGGGCSSDQQNFEIYYRDSSDSYTMQYRNGNGIGEGTDNFGPIRALRFFET